MHWRYLFNISFSSLSILNLFILSYKFVKLLKIKIPRLLSIEEYTEKILEQQASPFNNNGNPADRSNQLLMAQDNLIVNNFLNKMNNNPKKRNSYIPYLIDNNKLNGSDKKLSSNLDYYVKGCATIPIKQNSIKMIIEKKNFDSIKNFVNYNKFFLGRNQKDLIECRKIFEERMLLRKNKCLKDHLTFIQLNNLEFQKNILIMDEEEESINKEEENDFEQINKESIPKSKNRKLSIENYNQHQ